MKNLTVKVTLMFILSIIGSIRFVQAQQNYTGTAFLNPLLFEHERDSATIVNHFKTAFIKAFRYGDTSCFVRTKDQTPSSKTASQMLRYIRDYFRIKTGDSTLRGVAIADAIEHSTQFRRRYAGYWKDHLTAYVDIATGTVKWWDPTISLRTPPHGNVWIIAYIEIEGVTVEIIANCGNPTDKIDGPSTPDDNDHFQGPGPQRPADQNNGCVIVFNVDPITIRPDGSTTASWTTTNCGGNVNIAGIGTNLYPSDTKVVYNIQYTTTFTLTTPCGRTATATVTVNDGPSLVHKHHDPKWFEKHWGWCALAAGGITGGIIYFHDQHEEYVKDHVYNTDIQGGIGPSGAQNGTGGQITLNSFWQVATAQQPAIPNIGFKASKFTISHIFYFK